MSKISHENTFYSLRYTQVRYVKCFFNVRYTQVRYVKCFFNVRYVKCFFNVRYTQVRYVKCFFNVRYVKRFFTNIQKQQNMLKISLLFKKFTNSGANNSRILMIKNVKIFRALLLYESKPIMKFSNLHQCTFKVAVFNFFWLCLFKVAVFTFDYFLVAFV